MSGVQLILALVLIGVGGWLMYAVITNQPLLPKSLQQQTNTPTSNNPPGPQVNKGRYPL